MIKAERNGKGTGSVEISGFLSDTMDAFKGICRGARKVFVDKFGEDAGASDRLWRHDPAGK